MTNYELRMLLQDVETLRRQAETVEARLRAAIDPGGHQPAAAVRSYTDVRAREPDPRVADANKPPDDALLQAHSCPKCSSPMLWRFSRANGEWFAGCSTFKGREGCRGSRSFLNVIGEAPKREPEPPREPPRTSEGPMWTTDDLERIEKHHGPDAIDDAKIPF